MKTAAQVEAAGKRQRDWLEELMEAVYERGMLLEAVSVGSVTVYDPATRAKVTIERPALGATIVRALLSKPALNGDSA